VAALDLLLALLARGPVVSIDARETPVMVRVDLPYGTRHFGGDSVSSALAQALAATTPRAAKEES
jgi:hypothetical protein